MSGRTVLRWLQLQKSRDDEINCQTGHNTTLKRDTESVVNGEWIFYPNLGYLPVSHEFLDTCSKYMTNPLPYLQQRG